MRGVGKRNVAPRCFPTILHTLHPWQTQPHGSLCQGLFKPYIMRELRAMLSSHGLAVDHQRKVVKRALGGGVVGHGGQTFTTCGDFGIILGVYVVPDMALVWGKEAMSERHQAAGVNVPHLLYMCLLQQQAWVP